MSNSKWCAVVAGVGILLIPAPKAVHAQFLKDQLAQIPCGGQCLSADCNGNGLDDRCDISCNNDGNFCVGGAYGCLNDYCIRSLACGGSTDCNHDGVPDECQLSGNDCNGDGILDSCQGAPQACCTGLAAGNCTNTQSFCCDALGGVSAGAGTTCSSNICGNGALACCKGSDTSVGSFPAAWCDNHTPYGCAAHGGTILSTTQTCAALLFDPVVEHDADGDTVIDDACDNCSPADPTHHCNFFNCSNVDQTDHLDCVGGTYDGKAVACIAFINLCTTGGGICLYDGVGNACDNCLNVLNADQADVDGDNVGDVCDNCPAIANPGQEDCENGGAGNGVGDACDIAANPALDCDVNGILDECDIAANPALDCDVNGAIDACEIANGAPDCDGNGVLDVCDPDIDGDGILNLPDKCDYSPSTLTVETTGLFIGTVREDLDGDCDVDVDDLTEFNIFFQGSKGIGDSTCSPGANEEPLCPTTTGGTVQ